MTNEKVARANLDPENISQAIFKLDGETVDTELMTAAEGFESQPDHVVGVQDLQDVDGKKTRRFWLLPRKIQEDQPAEVSFYESHEALAKGIGAAAGILTGIVVARSLYVRRYKK